MKRLLALLVAAVPLGLLLRPQWQSLDHMGERRFAALARPSKELIVGVVWPFAANQDGMADGLRLSLDEINASGLAGGRQVRLVMRDPGLDGEAEKRVALEFADTPEMSAVVGYYDDSPAIKASAIYESSRLLHVIIGANSTPMTAHGFQYIVRTIVSSEKIARALAQMSVLRERRKVAVLWEEDAYGEDLAYQYRVALDALDGALVYQWSYSRERADFRLPVNELRGVDADTIFFAGLEPWAGDFIRMARSVGIRTEIVGAFSDTPEMRARAGNGLEGAMYFDEYDVDSKRPENQAFVKKFRARYSKDPDTWAAQGYDALQLVAMAVQATGSANSLDLSYSIRYRDPWEGANGRYKFDGRGELDDKPIYLDVYRNGAPVTFQVSGQVPEPPPHPQ